MKIESEPANLANRYVLETLLARSPVGVVWLASDTVLQRRVTVTLIDPRVAEDQTSRERLFANARALATAPATRLVRLLDAGMDRDVPFLVTERVDGETLADVLEREGPLAPARAAAIVADVLDAVAEAHAVGVLHLDLSPANVLLDEAGAIRLRNAGIAEISLRTATGSAPAAMPTPPEGADVDERSDVWCAGALLFTALTGEPPSDDEPDPVEAVRAPRPIRAILSRALAGDPDRRFADAAAMAIALRAASGTGASEIGRQDGGRRAVFRTWFAVPLVVAVVAAGVVIAGVWLGRLEIGGPVGIRIHQEGSPSPSTTVAPLPIADVNVLDPPPGDGHENDDQLPAAVDADPATVWRSENYFDGSLNKPGVGLVVDLGDDATVTGFRLDTPAPGFTFAVLVGDDPQTLLGETDGATSYTAPDAERGVQPRTGRYVLVWITSVVATPDGAHRAEISDLRIVGMPG